MDNLFDIDMILNQKKYSKIYEANIVFLIIFLIFIYIIFTYKYQSYYSTKGKMENNYLALLVNIEDVKYLKENNTLYIDDNSYSYMVNSISDELYVDENYHNYMYVYLKVNNLHNINNYVYEVKIPKENKILAKYLKDYL